MQAAGPSLLRYNIHATVGDVDSRFGALQITWSVWLASRDSICRSSEGYATEVLGSIWCAVFWTGLFWTGLYSGFPLVVDVQVLLLLVV